MTALRELEQHPELAKFFERMTYVPLAGKTHLLPPGGGGVGMHVIPVEKAISMENQTLDIEHLSYWLKKYEGHIGVGQCSCRTSRAVMGEGCVEKSKGVAEQFRIVAERQNVHFLNAADCEFNQVDFMHLTRKGHAQLADLLAKEVPTLL